MLRVELNGKLCQQSNVVAYQNDGSGLATMVPHFEKVRGNREATVFPSTPFLFVTVWPTFIEAGRRIAAQSGGEPNAQFQKDCCFRRGAFQSQGRRANQNKPGRRGRTRTCNPRIRNPMLYPFELRALNHGHHCI